MPSITQRGPISAKGFGFGASLTGGGDGTKAIFQLGSNSSIREKYTYASCSSTTSGVGQVNQTGYCQSYGTVNTIWGSGFSNYSKGIFTLGYIIACSCSCKQSISTNKYTFSTCSSVVGPNICHSSNGNAVSNKTIGILSIGLSLQCCHAALVNKKRKFTYSSCTFAAASANTAASASGSAVGNSTKAIIALGGTVYCSTCQVYSTKTATRNKYTYASDVTTACGVGSASVASARGSAAGNSTVGIFALGAIGTNCGNAAVATRNKYTYACCTSTAVGVASSSAISYNGSASGNSTRGIFALGCIFLVGPSTTRNKYTYSSCTSTACGVAVSSSSSVGGAAISWAVCVNS